MGTNLTLKMVMLKKMRQHCSSERHFASDLKMVLRFLRKEIAKAKFIAKQQMLKPIIDVKRFLMINQIAFPYMAFAPLPKGCMALKFSTGQLNYFTFGSAAIQQETHPIWHMR